MKPVRVDVILNARAGDRNDSTEQENLADTVRQSFAKHKLNPQIYIAHSGAEVIQLAERSIKGDAQVVVAAGGDGTVGSVAGVLSSINAASDSLPRGANSSYPSKKTLGVLPLGTLNHFAKDLGIPLDLDEAAKTIASGYEVEIDIGEVNDRRFINNSSLGLYPSIVRERQKQQRLGASKWAAFAWAAISVLRRYPFLDIELDAAGKRMVNRTPFVFVGNNKYEMETLNIGSRAALNEGQLSLYMSKPIGRFGLIRLALLALLGKLKHEKDFVALTTGRVAIASKHKRLRVALDGEVTVLEPPLDFRILPRALRVIVPEPAQTR